jgi:hypothetical protein
MAPEKCPYIDICPMFAYFTSNFSKAGYRIIYCLNKYDKCVRKPMRDRGEKTPDKLLSDGSMLE